MLFFSIGHFINKKKNIFSSVIFINWWRKIIIEANINNNWILIRYIKYHIDYFCIYAFSRFMSTQISVCYYNNILYHILKDSLASFLSLSFRFLFEIFFYCNRTSEKPLRLCKAWTIWLRASAFSQDEKSNICTNNSEMIVIGYLFDK